MENIPSAASRNREGAERLTIGDMAEINCTTKKRLRVYQEEGILEPTYVDEKTGYRYYTLDQCATLDAVTQLRALDFGLSEIREALKAADPARLKAEVAEKMTELDEKIESLQNAKRLGRAIMGTCDVRINTPLCGEIMLETLPDRRALVFDDVHDCDINLHEGWERASRHVKRQLIERGCPPFLFYNLSSTIPLEGLLQGDLSYWEALVFIDDDLSGRYGTERVIPGGPYLTMNFDTVAGKENPEYQGIETLLVYAEQQGFEVSGDYVCEIIANSPAIGVGKLDAMCKLELPVRRR